MPTPTNVRVPALLLALLLALSLVLSLGATTSPADAGSAARRPDLPVLPSACADPPYLAPRAPMRCRLKPPIKRAPTIVVLGDSHALQMVPALLRSIGAKQVNLVGFVFGACPPMDPRLRTPAQRRAASPCQLTGHKAMRYIDNSRRRGREIRVVVGAAWELYHHLQTFGDVPFMGHDVTNLDRVARQSATGTPRLFRTLKRWRVPTDVIGQSPFVPADPKPCPAGLDPYRCNLRRAVVLPHEAYNKRRLREWTTGLAGRPQLIETSNGFCGPKVCFGRLNGIYTYADAGHVSARMSRTLAPYFRPTVDAVVAATS